LNFGTKLAGAGGRVPTERGDILVGWERSAGRFGLTLSLPVNVEARVCLPNLGGLDATVRIDGVAATGLAEGSYIAVDDIGSGTHTFERVGR
jgi:hypothetical protein